MDLSRLINMIVNMVLRKAVNKGVDAGITYAAGRGKSGKDLSGDESAQAASAKETVKRARQAANLARRLGR